MRIEMEIKKSQYLGFWQNVLQEWNHQAFSNIINAKWATEIWFRRECNIKMNKSLEGNKYLQNNEDKKHKKYQ